MLSRCYVCDEPTKDWQEPCECGSRAFYRGKSLKGRMPDFDNIGRPVVGLNTDKSAHSEAWMPAPAFLLGEIPAPDVVKRNYEGSTPSTKAARLALPARNAARFRMIA